MADARRAVRECLQHHTSSVSDDATFLVAVSGGADSLALAWATAFELSRHGYRPMAVIVDHQLQEGSDEVAQTAKAVVQDFGLEAEIVRVSVSGDGGVENAARQARYDALKTHANTHGAEGVMLAHTLDDQAETVLLGLARGSGPQSLSGMAEVNGMWWRPFLGVRRQTNEQVLRDIGVSWWVDPQNSNRNLLRPRIRHDVLPLLEEALGPGVPEALARTADLLREDNDFLEGLAREAVAAVATDGGLSTGALKELPPVIISRVIRTAVSSVTREGLSHAHTTAVMALVTDWKGQGPIDVPGGTVRRVGSELVVTKTSSSSAAGETH